MEENDNIVAFTSKKAQITVDVETTLGQLYQKAKDGQYTGVIGLAFSANNTFEFIAGEFGYCEVLGALEIIKHQILKEATE